MKKIIRVINKESGETKYIKKCVHKSTIDLVDDIKRAMVLKTNMTVEKYYSLSCIKYEYAYYVDLLDIEKRCKK